MEEKTSAVEAPTYEAPRIQDYGTLVELTAGPFSGQFDSIFGANGGFSPGS